MTNLWDNLRPTRAREPWTAPRELQHAQDYLPTSAESPWGAPGSCSIKEVSGHATTFCKFLSSTLVPYVDNEFRTQTSERALVGKSFGGSGVAHALLDKTCSRLFEKLGLKGPLKDANASIQPVDCLPQVLHVGFTIIVLG